MKAWTISHHGGLDQLQWIEKPIPNASADQVRLRVRAVGLNHLDIWVRKGVPGHHFPLPMTPGCDIVGDIDAWGPKVSPAIRRNFKKGDSVIVNPILSCGKCPACKNNHPTLCKDFGLIGETCDGGCAEYCVVPAKNLFRRPKKISEEVAAALPIAFITAWQMVHVKGAVRAKDLVLIHAAGSGVSSAAIQMALQAKAYVIATVGSDFKLEKAKRLGAHYVLNHSSPDFAQEVKFIAKSLGKRGVDLAIDHLGGDTFTAALRLLNWGGKLIFCGATVDSSVRIDLKAVFFKNLSILGSTMGSGSDLKNVIRETEKKKLNPLIDRIFPASKLREAHEYLESRKAFGKVIMRMDQF